MLVDALRRVQVDMSGFCETTDEHAAAALVELKWAEGGVEALVIPSEVAAPVVQATTASPQKSPKKAKKK